MPRNNESIELTTRYCVYREFCKRYFNPASFDHFYDEEKSFYTIINKKANTPKVLKQVIELAREELKDEDLNSPVTFGRSTS